VHGTTLGDLVSDYSDNSPRTRRKTKDKWKLSARQSEGDEVQEEVTGSGKGFRTDRKRRVGC